VKKLQLIFIIIGTLHPIALASRSMHHFPPHITFSLSILTVIFPGGTGLVCFVEEMVMSTGAIKSYRAPDKLSPPTNQHPTFYRPDALPVTQSTVSEN